MSGVDFDIGAKERTGLVGINGTGKSTLANLIFVDLQPEGGFGHQASYVDESGWEH